MPWGRSRELTYQERWTGIEHAVRASTPGLGQHGFIVLIGFDLIERQMIRVGGDRSELLRPVPDDRRDDLADMLVGILDEQGVTLGCAVLYDSWLTIYHALVTCLPGH